MSEAKTLDINSDNDIRKYIVKARILGLHIIELNTHCEHKIYVISKTKTHHILLIPSDVEAVFRVHVGGKTYEKLSNLKGFIEVYGGWGLTTLELLFHTSSANKIDISNLQISEVLDMSFMFSYSDTTEVNMSNLNISSVAFMNSMFHNSCIETLDMHGLDFRNVTSTVDMFSYSALEHLNMDGVHLPNNADTKYMFDYCNIKQLIAQDRLIIKSYNNRLKR